MHLYLYPAEAITQSTIFLPAPRRSVMRKWKPMLASLVGAILAVAAAVVGNAAMPQSRAIRFVVPLSPGGAVDVIARLLAEQISAAEGAIVTVENRPGANGAIGTEAVARAMP